MQRRLIEKWVKRFAPICEWKYVWKPDGKSTVQACQYKRSNEHDSASYYSRNRVYIHSSLVESFQL